MRTRKLRCTGQTQTKSIHRRRNDIDFFRAEVATLPGVRVQTSHRNARTAQATEVKKRGEQSSGSHDRLRL